MVNLKGVLHWTLPVSDIERSEKFYTEVLNMKVIQSAPQAGMTFLRCGRDYFILAQTKQPLCVRQDDDNLIHHAFIVEADEYDATIKEMEGKGVRFFHHYDGPPNQGAFPGRSAHFHDPDRNVLEIIDLVAPAVRPKGITTDDNMKARHNNAAQAA